MSELDRISKLLAARFTREGKRGRIVFWRDDKDQYVDTVDGLVGAGAADPVLRDVELIRVNHDPFTVRYRMFVDQPHTRFLVYLAGSEVLPPKDDWLLDLELAYGPVFSADRLTMIATDMLPATSPDTRATWLAVMRSHPAFFDADSRIEALAARLTPEDDELDFQAKMIAVLLNLKGGKHSLQDIWRALLDQYAAGDSTGIDAIERMGLADFHWTGTRRIYRYETAADATPTVRDFTLWLFRLAWNGFVSQGAGADTYANIRRDFEVWRNDRTFEATFRRLSDDAAGDLGLIEEIGRMDIDELTDRDVFRAVDEKLILRMRERLGNGSLTAEQVERVMAARRGGLWFDEYRAQYEAINAACVLRRELDGSTAVIDAITAPDRGFDLYRDRLYRVDQAYRHFVIAWRHVNHDAPAIRDDLERAYALFQHRLGQAWQQQLDDMDSWPIAGVPAQTDFYHDQVEPRTTNGHKLAVIISDALRYEVAEELATAIRAENRYSADLTAQCGVLPSYTQLGMAALLPHHTLGLDPADHYGATVDGHSATGTANRNTILAGHDGRAITCKDLIALDRFEARDLIKSCNVLYVYHNHIDATGDSEKTERDVFDACNGTITELIDVIKKLANANMTNMVVTADHGFLYQDHDVDKSEWLSEQPQGDAIWVRKRRFAIGRNLSPSQAFVTLTADQLGLTQADGDDGLTVQIPNSILRLRMQGAGVRYVHGGAALQEIVVPVIHINKGRSASGDARPVDFRILQQINRITTGQLTVELVQDEAVEGRVLPRTVFLGLWHGDILISNETPVALAMTSSRIEERHVTATLVLTSEADACNNASVELRVRERIDGTGQMRTLPVKAVYTLRRGLAADDGFDFE